MSIRVICEVCQAEYSLKDEYAGKKIKCAKCENIMEVPNAVDEPAVARNADSAEVADPVFQRDKFLLRQQHLAINQKYYVYDDAGRTLMFVERPAHLAKGLGAGCAAVLALIVVIAAMVALGIALKNTLNMPGQALPAILAGIGFLIGLPVCLIVFVWLIPKRHITVYRDDTREERLVEILQDKKVAIINATYTVLDAAGNRLGRFRKNYLYNIFRRRWYGYDPDGAELVMALEDSLILSMLRRFLGPMLGILRTNFIITKPDGETLLGEFNRKFTLFDKYVLDMSADHEEYLDRRLAVALGVLLDTGEHR